MQSIPRLISSAATIAAALTIAACTNTPLYGPGADAPQRSSYPANNYPASSAYAQWGQVTNVEVIRGERSSGTVGTVAGGVVGGLAGSQVGGGTGKIAAAVVGAVGGALIGRAIEQNTRQPDADHYRVTVRLENNTVRNFDYAEPPNVRMGERVRVDGNQLYR
ncbi:MAG: glycine zipper 2TM domain-containing protein [Burkholderiales bacterium]